MKNFNNSKKTNTNTAKKKNFGTSVTKKVDSPYAKRADGSKGVAKNAAGPKKYAKNSNLTRTKSDYVKQTGETMQGQESTKRADFRNGVSSSARASKRYDMNTKAERNRRDDLRTADGPATGRESYENAKKYGAKKGESSYNRSSSTYDKNFSKSKGDYVKHDREVKTETSSDRPKKSYVGKDVANYNRSPKSYDKNKSADRSKSGGSVSRDSAGKAQSNPKNARKFDNRDNRDYSAKRHDKDKGKGRFVKAEAINNALTSSEPVVGTEYEKVIGRNPVREAIRSGRNISRLLVANGADASMNAIVNLARKSGINVQFTDKHKLDEVTGHMNHQGIIAYCSPIAFVEVADILAYAKECNENPFIVMTDNITDPHNLGAIIRSAYCSGAHGIITTKRNSAPITETVGRASAGSIEYMKIAQVSNLAQTLDILKENGLIAVCTDKEGEAFYKVDYDLPLVVLVGSEGEGVGKLLKSKCEIVASIPMKGQLDSLNASVAAGIVFMQVMRSRTTLQVSP
jgi:23S rRNA (guanosine2251-2'-O)-methyltransferase